jgi:hypothetical protein
MTIDEFRATLNGNQPPAVAPALRAMWYAANGNWNEAHRIAQDINNPLGAWVHAYLHRVEGDPGNARYWYRQADQIEATDRLDAEWSRIVAELLKCV